MKFEIDDLSTDRIVLSSVWYENYDLCCEYVLKINDYTKRVNVYVFVVFEINGLGWVCGYFGAFSN